jgi:hypothetical protein
MPDPVTKALDLIRQHAEICSRAGQYDHLLSQADLIEAEADSATFTYGQIWDVVSERVVAYNLDCKVSEELLGDIVDSLAALFLEQPTEATA